MEVIYEDAEVLVAIKSTGVKSGEARGPEPSMVNPVRRHLAVSGKGIPYVGLICRLDKPVTGLVLFDKAPAAAATLSKEPRAWKMEKHYRAIVLGKPAEKARSFTDWISRGKKTNLSHIVSAGAAEAKETRLRYRVFRNKFVAGRQVTEVEIGLLTGRRHRVRVQFVAHGLPLVGDRKYGSTVARQETLFCYGGLRLAATGLSFTQPKTRRKLSFTIEPPSKITPWKGSINPLLRYYKGVLVEAVESPFAVSPSRKRNMTQSIGRRRMHGREKDGLRRFLLELKEERLVVAEAVHSGASCDIGHIKELREVLKQIKDVDEHKFEACPESERYLNTTDHTKKELVIMEDSIDLFDEASHLAAAGAGNENLFEIDELLMEVTGNLWTLL